MELEKGEIVGYISKDGARHVLATVVDIHYDDDVPYYTIKTWDGREINTVRKRLIKVGERTRVGKVFQSRDDNK